MQPIPNWQYDEFHQCGTDYADPSQVARYDERHQRFRRYQQQAQSIIDTLSLHPAHTVIDIGSGTGAFTLYAARRCRKVIAVDVSLAMLEYCRQKAQAANLNNIEFCHAGFLTYQHNDAPVDAIVSVAALHHLPDFWKLIALSRMAQMLKPQGKLYLADVVFTFEPAEYREQFDRLVDGFAASAGEDQRRDLETHIREEFSTTDWILQAMLERVGFTIDHARALDGLLMTVVCTKK